MKYRFKIDNIRDLEQLRSFQVQGIISEMETFLLFSTGEVRVEIPNDEDRNIVVAAMAKLRGERARGGWEGCQHDDLERGIR